jgi:hypothetical protein
LIHPGLSSRHHAITPHRLRRQWGNVADYGFREVKTGENTKFPNVNKGGTMVLSAWWSGTVTAICNEDTHATRCFQSPAQV